jgi:hypothetical protein
MRTTGTEKRKKVKTTYILIILIPIFNILYFYALNEKTNLDNTIYGLELSHLVILMKIYFLYCYFEIYACLVLV